MGVHPQNRGGNYPKGTVVKNLGVSIGKSGFTSEEANHAGVCVEEIPPAERTEDPMEPGSPYVTYLTMNKRKQPQLRSCLRVSQSILTS